MMALNDSLSAGCPTRLAPPETTNAPDSSAFVRRVGGQNRLGLTIRGAKCGACINRIESAVKALPDVETARLNLSTGTLDVAWRGDLGANTIVLAVSTLGYGVSPQDQSRNVSDEQREERSLLIALGVAGFATSRILSFRLERSETGSRQYGCTHFAGGDHCVLRERIGNREGRRSCLFRCDRHAALLPVDRALSGCSRAQESLCLCA